MAEEGEEALQAAAALTEEAEAPKGEEGQSLDSLSARQPNGC